MPDLDSSFVCATGCSGQVGRALTELHPEIYPLNHRLDSELDDLISTLASLRPSAMVHTAAYTAVDQTEIAADLADQVNHIAVDRLSRWCHQYTTPLIHYSTDYVFDGKKRNAYLEDDQCNPLNHYGQTKHRGELAFLEHRPPGCIFRTSWVLGTGKNFIQTILTLGLEKQSLSVIDDQIGRPTSAKLLAQAALEVVDRAVDLPQLPQRVHLSDSGAPVSWHGLATYAVNRARDWQYPGIQSEKIRPVSSSAYGQTVLRPHNSVLNCDRFDRLFDLTRPSWHQTVDTLVEEIARHAW